MTWQKELVNTLNLQVAKSSGTQRGYFVEAKVNSGVGLTYELSNGQIITKDWTRIKFAKNTEGRGVPITRRYDFSGQLENNDLYCYESAQTLRWWLLAETDSSFVLTRIVECEIKYQYEINRVGEMDEIDVLDRDTSTKSIQKIEEV